MCKPKGMGLSLLRQRLLPSIFGGRNTPAAAALLHACCPLSWDTTASIRDQLPSPSQCLSFYSTNASYPGAENIRDFAIIGAHAAIFQYGRIQ